MKKLLLIAAMAAGVVVVPAAANAAPGQERVTRTTVTRTSDTERRWNGGQRWKWKKVCTTKWRHGKKWRQCRNVRVRW